MEMSPSWLEILENNCSKSYLIYGIWHLERNFGAAFSLTSCGLVEWLIFEMPRDRFTTIITFTLSLSHNTCAVQLMVIPSEWSSWFAAPTIRSNDITNKRIHCIIVKNKKGCGTDKPWGWRCVCVCVCVWGGGGGGVDSIWIRKIRDGVLGIPMHKVHIM